MVQLDIFTVRFIARVATILLLIAGLVPASAIAAADTHADECVVLVHGMGRTSHSMDDMEQSLQAAGYRTVNIDYPSRSHPIQDLADRVGKQAIAGCRNKQADTIHFITHSLGGIVVRYFLARNDVPELGRVVMLAPPNQGSLLADQLRDEHWYKWLMGPAGQQLGTGRDGVPGMLGAVDYDTGVIAGNVHSPIDNWLAEKIPGQDDGKVSVDHTRVDGMRDFLILPYTHITIMNQPEVIQQSLYFLRHGSFDHNAADRLQRAVTDKNRGYFD